jgi:hypothetical protein
MWQGQLGKQDFSETAPDGQPARMVLQTKNIPGAVFRVEKLAVQTTVTQASLPVFLDDEEQDFSVASNQVGLQLAPLDIPLDGKTHTIEIPLPAGTRARINKLCCVGCGACSGPDLFLSQTGGTVQGISITGKVDCTTEALDIPCYGASVNEQGSPNFPVVQPILAQAVRYASAAKYCRNLISALASGSRYVDLTPDQLLDLAINYEAKLDKHITWLVTRDALAGLNHPCYHCESGAMLTMVKTY